MSFFNQTRKTINISTYNISDPTNANQISVFSKSITFDLVLFREYVNTVMYPVINTLTSKPRYPKDVLESGLSGETIVTWLESQGNSNLSSALFWDSLSLRPKTIKESFDYLMSITKNSIVQNITNTNADLEGLRNELLALIDDVSNIAECNRDNVTRLALDVFGSSYVLDCTNTQTLTTPVYTQLNNLKTALGFNNDGTKNDFTSTNYINANSTIVAAINILDDKLKEVADASGGGPIDDSTYAKKPESNTFISTTPSETLTNRFVTNVEVGRGDLTVFKEASSNYYMYLYSRYGLDKDDLKLQFFTTTDNGVTRTIKSLNLQFDSETGVQPYTYLYAPNGTFFRPNSSLPYTNNSTVTNVKLESDIYTTVYLEISTSYDDPPVMEGYPGDIDIYISKLNNDTGFTYLDVFTINDSTLQDPRLTKIFAIDPITLELNLVTTLDDVVTYETESPSFGLEPTLEREKFIVESSTGNVIIDLDSSINFKSAADYSYSPSNNKIIFNHDVTDSTSEYLDDVTIKYKRGSSSSSDRNITWSEYSNRFSINQTTLVNAIDEYYAELFFQYNIDIVDKNITLELIEYNFGNIPKRVKFTTINSSAITKVDNSYNYIYTLSTTPYSNSGYYDVLVKLKKSSSYYIVLNYENITSGAFQIKMQKQNESGTWKTNVIDYSGTSTILAFSTYDNTLSTSYIDYGTYVENDSYDSVLKIRKSDGFNEQKSILLNSNSYSADSNASIEVERGSSNRRASIKWNEEVDQWQFYPELPNTIPTNGTVNQILAWDDSEQAQWKTLSVGVPFVHHTRMDRFNYATIQGSTKTVYSQDQVSFEALGNSVQLFSYKDSNGNELQPGQILSAVDISLWDGNVLSLYTPPYFAVYTNNSVNNTIVINKINISTEVQSDTSIVFVPVKFDSSNVLYERSNPGDYSLYYSGDYLVSRKFAVTSVITVNSNLEFINGIGSFTASLDFITLNPGESIALVMLEIGGKSEFDTYFKPYIKGLNITYNGYSLASTTLT